MKKIFGIAQEDIDYGKSGKVLLTDIGIKHEIEVMLRTKIACIAVFMGFVAGILFSLFF